MKKEKTEETIEFSVPSGTCRDVYDFIRAMHNFFKKELKKNPNITVTGNFNGPVLIMTKGSSIASTKADYEAQRKAESELYWKSPNGLKELARREEKQKNFDELICKMPTSFKSHWSTISWLENLSNCKNRYTVVPRNFSKNLISQLEKAGYQDKAVLPEKPTKEEYAKWFVGSVLNMLKTTTFNTNLVNRFAREWKQNYQKPKTKSHNNTNQPPE
jgi:hypothetical protein